MAFAAVVWVSDDEIIELGFEGMKLSDSIIARSVIDENNFVNEILLGQKGVKGIDSPANALDLVVHRDDQREVGIFAICFFCGVTFFHHLSLAGDGDDG